MPKVSDAIRVVEEDGWQLVRYRGSHRHYAHPAKPGVVTIAGRPSKDLPPGTWNSILRQAGLKQWSTDVQHKYVVVYEQSPTGYAAYVPDLPGCIAAGDTRDEVEQLIREAMALHIELLRERGEPVPEPGTWTGLITV